MLCGAVLIKRKRKKKKKSFVCLLQNSHKVRCHWEDADLCDVTNIDKMAESSSRVFPKTPDILVNNAGNPQTVHVCQTVQVNVNPELILNNNKKDNGRF